MGLPALHHYGYVVESIDASAPGFLRSLGFAGMSRFGRILYRG